MMCKDWTHRQEAWQGQKAKYTHFVDEETEGHRGPATELCGIRTFASLLQSRLGSLTPGNLSLPN